MSRRNFSDEQRRLALHFNAAWLQEHRVTGVYIEDRYEALRTGGLIHYCENCLFCHTDQQYFDVDHLVPDQKFRIWGKHDASNASENMMVLCKSLVKGDFGCNQCKNAKLYVPRGRGLAFTLRTIDMNCFPLKDRPFDWAE